MSENLQNSISDDNVSIETLLQRPWHIWKQTDAYEDLLRRQLLKFVEKALEIRLRRQNYEAELEKKRSRKGAAAKRALASSKKQATRLKESFSTLDLDQLWTSLEKQVSGGFGDLKSRLDNILLRDLTNIWKNETNAIDTTYKLNDKLNSFNQDEIGDELESDSDTSVQENRLDEDSEYTDSQQEGESESDDDNEVESGIKEDGESKLEDGFFKMDEMEEFADKEFESDDINYFDSLGEESDESVAADAMKYGDFFKEPKKSKSKLSRASKRGFDADSDAEPLDKEEAELERLLQQAQDEIDTDEDEEEEEEGGGGDDDDYDEDYAHEDDDDGIDIEKEKLGDLAFLDGEFGADFTGDNDNENDPIAAIERDLAADKHWSLLGEATAARRPRNSLLDVDVELPQLARTIHQGKDESLLVVGDALDEDDAALGDDASQSDPRLEFEEIIKQRIKAQVFDNVERKMALEDQLEAIERLKKNKANVEAIDFNKSTLGLGDLYAQRYMDHFMATDKLDAHKKKLTESFAKLMCKLDALCNYNMVPKLTSRAQQAAAIPMLTVDTPMNIVTTKRQAAESPINVKVSRGAKKRKFTNKLKALLKSGKLDQVQVQRIRASIQRKNQKRIADAKMAKTSGNVKQKDTRRLNIGQLLQDISNK